MGVLLIAALLMYFIFLAPKDIHDSLDRRAKYNAYVDKCTYSPNYTMGYYTLEICQLCMEERKLYHEAQEKGIGIGEPLDEDFFKRNFDALKEQCCHGVRPITYCYLQVWILFSGNYRLGFRRGKCNISDYKSLQGFYDRYACVKHPNELYEGYREYSGYNNLDPVGGWEYDKENDKYIPINEVDYLYPWEYKDYKPDNIWIEDYNGGKWWGLGGNEYYYYRNEIDSHPQDLYYPIGGGTREELEKLLKYIYMFAFRDNFPALKFLDRTQEDIDNAVPEEIPIFEKSPWYHYIDDVLNENLDIQVNLNNGMFLINGECYFGPDIHKEIKASHTL